MTENVTLLISFAIINAGLGDVAQRTADVVSELDFCIVKNEALFMLNREGRPN